MPYLTATSRDFRFTFRPQYRDVQVDYTAPAYMGRRAAVLFATNPARARVEIERYAAVHDPSEPVLFENRWELAGA